MIARGEGRLIHLGSAIADVPSPRLAVYSAAKAGLRQFSVALDLEVRQQGVRSTVVEPIYVRLPDSGDPLGVTSFATHHLPLEQAPHGYEIFRDKADGCLKVVLQP